MRIFDGHNDVLLRIHAPRPGEERSFFRRSAHGHLDLPRARAGGMVGGLFAVFVPSPREEVVGDKGAGREPPAARPVPEGLARPVEPGPARKYAMAMITTARRVADESDGRVRIVDGFADLARCIDDGVFAVVLHLEGAEPIGANLEGFDELCAAGVRSVGITWSRANAFGCGVPFRCPSTPDIGPGLTDAGRRLVTGCNRRGVMVDLAHLNERGFWDVAEVSTSPLVSTHTAAHALCPSARNLTDAQVDAVGRSGGVIGVTFGVNDLRPDGRFDAETPLEAIVRQVDYIADRIGVDHVAFGSDFDGNTVPATLGDAAGLPRLLDALAAAGYNDHAISRITERNWLRVLERTWQREGPALRRARGPAFRRSTTDDTRRTDGGAERTIPDQGR